MTDARSASTGMVAVVNAGSSSLKFSLFECSADGLTLVMRGLAQGLDSAARFEAKDPAGKVLATHAWEAGQRIGHDAALHHVIEAVRGLLPGVQLRAIGHRVVHGGTEFSAPELVTPEVLEKLTGLIPLAPLHQPDNLAPIRLAFDLLPDVPQVACFDTAFHRSMAPLAQMFALPYTYYDEGLRRYGFHGLSYEYIASRLPDVAPALASGRAAVMHLGNGASACGLLDGRSIASTMGFSALDGLTMGTRCGAIDPGVVLHLIQQRGMSAADVERMLYRQSGLLGISGVSSDMRTLLASDEPRAKLAVEHFVYRIVRELGSLAFAMGGLDGLVFTGGIGEHAAPVRQRVVAQMAWFGAELDAEANAANATCITTPASRCAVYVIPTDEELMIARHTLRALDA
ncbi:acetate/propionate family kinase [Variovorax dokdonensis]|uniref:Acetate kinase n=1 Tax=Variovorax dokdonensis TaxID=344883 RepID=A0ABT7NCQ9_9BURK|nr:acetate/propionate family kinase [Variovorax dokdonensis]MDM0045736.1 acetate/propionate family kinase [Variovorax dokdonensis]